MIPLSPARVWGSPCRAAALGASLAAAALVPLAAAAHPSEGLWVGRAVLKEVNEAVGALDKNGVRVQSPPARTTRTADEAEIFLIVHVDGAGQVRLLKSVAIADKDNDPLTVSESLITDPSLFADLPVARRLATAAFEFGDPRSRTVVGSVATAAAAAAATAVAANGNPLTLARSAAQNAVVDALLPGDTASLAAFVNGASFQASPEAAAKAANDAAVEEYAAGRRNQELTDAVRSKVLIALATLSQMADAASLNELPLTGSLTKGGTLSGDIFLGAYHPTNPFRHRRNPAHRGGYDIQRRLTFTIPAASTESPDFDTTERGLDRLTGVYEEEVRGLHKPLGQSGEYGLRTKGTFVLDRISHDATLND